MSSASVHREARLIAGPISRIAIVGGAGEVGRLIGRVLAPAAARVEVVDVRAKPNAEPPEGSYVRADVMRWLDQGESLLGEADCVVLALPEEVALRALAPLAERMPHGALLVDTLSVKREVVAAMRRLPAHLERLSLNPMFGPALDLRGQSVLAVEVSPGMRSDHFLDLFRGAGCRVVGCEAEEHDRMTAALQALTHATVLSFGAALAEHGEDLVGLMRVAPPPFVAMTALLARILAGRATTYYGIQASNDHAQRARDLLASAGEGLESAVGAGPAGFSEFLCGLDELLGSKAGPLEGAAQQMLEALARRQATERPSGGNGKLWDGVGRPLVGEIAERREDLLEEGV